MKIAPLAIVSLATFLPAQTTSQSLEQVRAARQADPYSLPLALQQARILVNLHRYREADELLEQASTAYPRAIEVLTLEAELAKRLNRLDKAQALLLRCTQLTPDDAQAWKRLGDFYLFRKDAGALDCFRRATGIAPSDAQAWAGRASAESEAGKTPAAEEDFARSAALNVLNRAARRDNAQVDLLYADFLRERGRYAESLVEYDRALAKEAALPPALLGRGMSLIQLGRWEQARKDLELAAPDSDSRLQALNLLLKVYRQQGDNAKASRCASEIDRISRERMRREAAGTRIASELARAAALVDARKIADAQQAYEQIVQEHPEVASAYAGVARAFANLQQWQAADAAIGHYLALEPDSVSGHLLLGRILLQEKKAAPARAAFLQAAALDPLQIDAQLGAAAGAILLHNYPEAIQELRLRWLARMCGSCSPKRSIKTARLSWRCRNSTLY